MITEQKEVFSTNINLYTIYIDAHTYFTSSQVVG